MITLQKDAVAIMNIQYKYFPLAKFLDDAVAHEVRNIELWGAAPHFHLEDMTWRDIAAVRTDIERRGLKLVCYTPEQCVYPVNIAAESPAERRRSVKFFEDNIRATAELGCDKMLVTSGWGYFDGSNSAEAWKYAAEGLYGLAGLAQQQGVTLALEVLRKDESNLVNDLPSLHRMLTELGHSSVGGMIDTIPMALSGESPREYLETLGDRLVHVHFIDGAPRGHLAWGDGILNMRQYLIELSEGGYKGYLSLEITDGRYITDPTASVKKSVDALYAVLQ